MGTQRKKNVFIDVIQVTSRNFIYLAASKSEAKKTLKEVEVKRLQTKTFLNASFRLTISS